MTEIQDIITPRTRLISNMHALNIKVQSDILVCMDLSHLEVAWFLVRHDPELYISITNGSWPTYKDLLTTYEIVYNCEKVFVLLNRRTKDIILVYGMAYNTLQRFAQYSQAGYVAMEKSMKPVRPVIKHVRDINAALKKLDARANGDERKLVVANILIDYIFNYNDPL